MCINIYLNNRQLVIVIDGTGQFEASVYIRLVFERQ